MRGERTRRQRHIHSGASDTPRRGGRVWRLVTQRFTVMLIPHSDQHILNFHLPLPLVVLFVGLMLAVVGGFVYLSSVHLGSVAIIESRTRSVQQNQASLDALLAEVQSALQRAEVFHQQLGRTAGGLGFELRGESAPSAAVRGDLASFFDLEAVGENQISEIQQLRDLSEALQRAVRPLADIRAVVDSQRGLLSDIPNLWPVEYGGGRITMEFGPNIHPITGQWFLHKGIDIAGMAGTPIVASANGKVVSLGYDSYYGLNVWIRHKYGFRTRYSHLQSILVSEGQDVVQGEQIGTLGNSGLSPGPHLDFAVMLGTEVVDPATFLRISNDFVRSKNPTLGVGR